VVEVAVGQEDVASALELGGAAADVEGEARRMDSKPGRIAGPRRALERQLAEPEMSGQISR
jgi:hypothetical protein